MRMFLKSGKDGAPTSENMRSADVWENAVVLKMTNHTIESVKKDQTYKILFETDQSVNATLRVDMVYRDRLLQEGKIYDDFLYARDKSCYKYNIKSADKKFRVGVYSFSGNPDVYVTPETEDIENLDKYEFKATICLCIKIIVNHKSSILSRAFIA